MAINPADSQRCANELAGKNPSLVVSTLNFFGNHFPIYEAAGINTVVSVPISLADFTFPGVYSLGAGGGCLGVHTGLVYAATQELGAKRVAVPWADTPPGVVCYYDLFKKPLDVLKGETPGSAELAGSMPELEHIGVPVKPATPDVTPQVTQALDFEPEAITFSGQGADCWNFVDGLGRQGWSADKVPLLMSSACVDLEKMEQAGDLAKGVYFVGAAGGSITNPAVIDDPRLKLEAETYVAKAAEYGAPQAEIGKGFGANAWSTMLTIWEQSSIIVNEGGDLTPESLSEQFARTQGNHINGSVPFGCAEAPDPYTAVCNSKVGMQRWDGEKLEIVVPVFSGIELVAGTELQPGP
jgi:branched-chain amino acid transport system substrate-binding protein